MNINAYNHYVNILSKCRFYTSGGEKRTMFRCILPDGRVLSGSKQIALYFGLNSKTLYNASVELSSMYKAIERLLRVKFIGRGTDKFTIKTEDGLLLKGVPVICEYYSINKTKLYYLINHGNDIRTAVNTLISNSYEQT